MRKTASKRILAWVIAALMVVTYMPSMAFAEATETEEPNI